MVNAPIVSISKYGSPNVGTMLNSSLTELVSSTNKKGFSPSNVRITLSPSVFDTFSLSINDVPVGIYNGYIISSIALDCSAVLYCYCYYFL